MENSDEKFEEDWGTTQKIEVAAGEVANCTETERENITRQTTENVRIREEAAAKCTKVIKKRVLKKQARKARAEHLVKCCLAPGRRHVRRKPLSKLYVNWNFTEDSELSSSC